ncbi:flagellar hook-basal body protein [Enterococcus alcedinis]|uniref:Flagellar basal body protein n=1 Tax=Enterococcus alcedinis TaxID=1274384 RepID=A0A917JG45_9ENTE|nr:flagellar hook-basal body complex protein [Enterococcus alcedinis]MBP2102607.1 flagellar basal-body rod protein FlgG [Enterococcus alcedinis]GGI66166.1 flagellar basal body protein [Enterococcus alcedinis]
MIRSIDTLTKNFQILQKRQENTSSNMANSQTTGFQSQRLFQQTLEEVDMMNHQGGPEVNRRNPIGGFTFGNEIAGSALDTSRGALEQTTRTTDFAVKSEGYFSVRMPNGQEGYTRNGHFGVNAQNELVTQEGYLVLGANNQGVAANDTRPNFKITAFNEPQRLQIAGNGYFTSQVAGTVVANAQVNQGYLETSNVTVADEMVELMQTAREYEANQKVLSTVNQTLQKATNEIGRV